MIRTLQALLILTVLTGCQSSHSKNDAHQKTGPDQDVEAVAELLTGVFDSRAQAATDPDNFFEIRLVTVPIWGDRQDGRWLYVEQAAFSALDRPYRQRVYNIRRDADGVLRSDVYELPDPGSAVACWKQERPLENVSPSELMLRDGCSIMLAGNQDSTYGGSTIGEGCSSSLAGAAYATSIVTLSDGLLVSWDRGWNAQGEQVWGATAGGYRFERQSQHPTE